MTFSFSVTRLLAAMGVCAVALSLTNDLGDYRVLGAVCVGVPVALLVLFAGKRDLLQMVRTFLWCWYDEKLSRRRYGHEGPGTAAIISKFAVAEKPNHVAKW